MAALDTTFQQLGDGARLAIAYSGGLDSTVLLHVAAATVPGDRLRALHVRHDFSERADEWAAHCAGTCRVLGIGLRILPVVTAGDRADGPESAGRRLRYQAIAEELEPDEWAATAHHARDQAETLLLQALRGAGVSGLAGMPGIARLGAGWLWRPWRTLERRVIADYARRHKLDWIDDPSNADEALARGRLRTAVWPVLTEAFPSAERTLARSAHHAANAAEAVTALAGYDLQLVRVDTKRLSISQLQWLTPARRAEVLRHWLADCGLDSPSSAHVAEFERLIHARAHGGPRLIFADTELRVYAGAVYAMPRLAPAPAKTIDWSGSHILGLPSDGGELVWHGDRSDLRFSVTFGAVDKRIARGDGTSKRLNAWFQENGWPPWIRERAPLVYLDSELIAVADAWQHPEFEQRVGGNGGFEWRHELVGDPRSVADRASIN